LGWGSSEGFRVRFRSLPPPLASRAGLGDALRLRAGDGDLQAAEGARSRFPQRQLTGQQQIAVAALASDGGHHAGSR